MSRAVAPSLVPLCSLTICASPVPSGASVSHDGSGMWLTVLLTLSVSCSLFISISGKGPHRCRTRAAGARTPSSSKGEYALQQRKWEPPWKEGGSQGLGAALSACGSGLQHGGVGCPRGSRQGALHVGHPPHRGLTGPQPLSLAPETARAGAAPGKAVRAREMQPSWHLCLEARGSESSRGR